LNLPKEFAQNKQFKIWRNLIKSVYGLFEKDLLMQIQSVITSKSPSLVTFGKRELKNDVDAVKCMDEMGTYQRKLYLSKLGTVGTYITGIFATIGLELQQQITELAKVPALPMILTALIGGIPALLALHYNARRSDCQESLEDWKAAIRKKCEKSDSSVESA
jgi:hypothetical protein